MRSLFSDKRIESALEIWKNAAAQIGLDEDTFDHKLLWQKDEPYRNHVVIAFNSPDRNLVLKQIFKKTSEKDPCAAALAQKNAHQVLANQERAHAPELLFMSQDGSTVIMEQVRGQTLDSHLSAGKDPVRLLRRTGQWLARFHGATHEGSRIYQPKFMENHIARIRSDVADGNSGVADRDLFLQCCDLIPEIARGFEGQTSVSCAKHGDFNLRNVILGPDGATAIDFKPHQTAPVGFDICQILLDYAELYQDENDVESGKVLSAKTLSAFFDGYDFVKVGDPGVGFLQYVQLLNDWRLIPVTPAHRSWRQALRHEKISTLAKKAFGLN